MPKKNTSSFAERMRAFGGTLTRLLPQRAGASTKAAAPLRTADAVFQTCAGCAARLRPTAKFCGQCGKPVGRPATVPDEVLRGERADRRDGVGPDAAKPADSAGQLTTEPSPTPLPELHSLPQQAVELPSGQRHDASAATQASPAGAEDGAIRIVESFAEGPDPGGRYRVVTVFELADQPAGAVAPVVLSTVLPEFLPAVAQGPGPAAVGETAASVSVSAAARRGEPHGSFAPTAEVSVPAVSTPPQPAAAPSARARSDTPLAPRLRRPSAWRVRLLEAPFHQRRSSFDSPSFIVMVVGQEGRPWDRSALGSALFSGHAWRCIEPPGSAIPGGLLPEPLLAGDGKVSYRDLKASGDSASVLQRLFPYLDGVFKVDASSETIEEWELSESSLNFFLKFDVLAKPERFFIELIEFMPG